MKKILKTVKVSDKLSFSVYNKDNKTFVSFSHFMFPTEIILKFDTAKKLNKELTKILNKGEKTC